MIRLREKQLGQIAQALALERFEDEMIVHLRSFAPGPTEASGDEGVRRTIQLGITRARAYGVTNPGLLRFYVELMFMLGAMFDTDLLHAWAGEILRDHRIPDEATRIDRLYDAALRYHEAGGGPEGSFTIQAIDARGRG